MLTPLTIMMMPAALMIMIASFCSSQDIDAAEIEL
jgi:hypothetical protein